MCGEHFNAVRNATSPQGSSPHVRGAPAIHVISEVFLGIIPACAGSTRRRMTLRLKHGDHPRMCGEHQARPSPSAPSSGLSPHVRGAPADCRLTPISAGIIPACAGSTRARMRVAGRVGDHPRMCGEHSSGIGMMRYGTGSSPHVRGAPISALTTSSSCGIIPACAGSTPSKTARRWRTGDHPRMCGEHSSVASMVRMESGSSPHVRGALCST